MRLVPRYATILRVETEKHFDNLLNFLFRTDKLQSRTDINTQYNVLFTWDSKTKTIQTFNYGGNDLNLRKEEKTRIRAILLSQFANVNDIGITKVFLNFEDCDNADEQEITLEQLCQLCMTIDEDTRYRLHPLYCFLLMDNGELPRLQIIYDMREVSNNV